MVERCVISWSSYNPKQRTPWQLLFPLSVFILFIPNASKKYYHFTGSDELYAQHKGGLASVAWENAVSDHGAAMDQKGK